MLEERIRELLESWGGMSAWEISDAVSAKMGRRVSLDEVQAFLHTHRELFDAQGSGTVRWSIKGSPSPGKPRPDDAQADDQQEQGGIAADPPCPRCGSAMTLRMSNRGKAFMGCTRFPQCRGSADVTGPSGPADSPRTKTADGPAPAPAPSGRSGRGTGMRIGDLVASSANAFGPGKAVAQEGKDAIVVEYFDHPGTPPEDRYREPVPRVSLRRLAVNNETRVFWEQSGEWRSGRVMRMTDQRDFHVKGHEWEGFVDERNLYVRWQRPLEDPVGFGTAGLLESPLLVGLRRPFLQATLRQRSAAHGMSGVISGSIEFHAHQVEIARRVLEDPIQRYLLADEVGLGKTIEAGMVIRQLLLDDPALSVQLILPPFLVAQWRRELEGKFHTHTFSRASIRFSRDDDPDDWGSADLIVVDEAHNLARMSSSTEPSLAARYARLRDVALESPRLLLLSATPVLHNEAVLLAMLRLLDPQVYGASDEQALRERVEGRAALGRILLGLRAGLPGVLMRARLGEVSALFPTDPDVQEIVAAAARDLEEGEKERLERRITQLRVHVSEVYRLHRRMLRTRRTEALGATYMVTGRRLPDLHPRDVGLADRVDLLIDAWRQELLARTESDLVPIDDAALALAEACELAGDPPSLSGWARERAGQTDGPEQEALRRLARGLEQVKRKEEIAAPVADELTYEVTEKERMVVFCMTTALAIDLAAELEGLLGEGWVATHLLSDEATAAEAAVRDFADTRGTSRVLVCDRSAEEGRNLQFADVLVHLGLPADVNRLEQRIGRLDRWHQEDSGKPWRAWLVADPEGSGTLTDAWRQILVQGFGIFERSVASLQHAVEVAALRAWRVLLTEGAEGVISAVQEVRQALEEETERVREQDALDAIEAVAGERSAFATLQAAEDEAASFAGATDALLADRGEPGNLRFQRIGDPVGGAGGYRVRGKDIRGEPLFPLIPTWRILRDLVALESTVGTFRRDIAVAHPGTQLYRYGAPLIDAVADFLWHDDRGRAFGMWRWIPGWTMPERPAYRFDYHVEAGSEIWRTAIRQAAKRLDERAVQRRADAVFPPVIVSLWLDGSGTPISDRELITALEQPYRKPTGADDPRGGDFSLNRERISWAYEFVAQRRWGEAWREVEAAAERSVRDDPQVQTAIDRGLANARVLLEGRLHQLRLRALRAPDDERGPLEEEIALEESLAEAVQKAIAEPRLKLDATGFVIVSGAVPGVGMSHG